MYRSARFDKGSASFFSELMASRNDDVIVAQWVLASGSNESV